MWEQESCSVETSYNLRNVLNDKVNYFVVIFLNYHIVD
jgi:hypothetical protein